MVDIEIMKPQHLFFMENWHKDDQFMYHICGLKKSMNREEVMTMIQKWITAGDIPFIVKYNNNPVGYITIRNITPNSSAEIHLALYKNRGIGIMPKALKKVLDFAFEKVKLHRVCAYLPEYKKGIIKMLKKEPFGLKLEGIMKDALYHDNQYKDVYCYATLDKEYKEYAGRTLWAQQLQ